MINTKIRKKIKRYGRLRFAGDKRYSEDVLLKIYNVASKSKRERIKFEIDNYLKAIEDGKLNHGDSMLKVNLS